MPKRVFICCDIDQDVREQLSKVVDHIRRTDPSVRTVAGEGLHITLKFLGEAKPELVEAVVIAVRDACAHAKAHEISIAGVGAFPTLRRPRVIWAGVREGADSLQRLQREIEASLSALGFPAEARPFHPHLTLGRVRSNEGAAALVAALQKWRHAEFGRSLVTEVVLMSSELQRTGAVYTPLERFGLRR